MPTEESTQDQQAHGRQFETAGTVLSRERNKRGLDEKQVADHLHITVHYVKAIEADNYDKLPGTIFAKGYIKSYAEYLGLDAGEVVARYQELLEQNKPQKTQIRTAPRKPRRQRNLQWAIASVAVFSAVLITAWLISGDSQRTESSALEGPATVDSSSGDIVQPEPEPPTEPVNILEQLANEDRLETGRSAAAAPVAEPPEAVSAANAQTAEASERPQPDVSAEPQGLVPEETITESADGPVEQPAETSEVEETGRLLADNDSADTETESADAPVEQPAEPSEVEETGRLLADNDSADTETESADAPVEQPAEPPEVEETGRLLADNDSADTDAVLPASAAAAADSTAAVPRPEDVAAINVLQGANGERIIAVDANGEDVLRISFSGESWVEVNDGDARQIYRDLRQAGDVLEITGHAPFNILLGDAPLTSLHFNGDEIDVSDDIRIDNSARLTVGL